MDDVYLRAVEVSDLDRTWKWHNDPELYELLVSAFRYVSHAAEEEWIHRKTAYSQTEIRLAICLQQGDQHIGNIHLTDIDWVSRHACIGIFMGEPQHWSKGYGQQAMRLLLRHAFDDLGLYRLYLTVLADNLRAIRVYEKCGLVVEGRLRQHAYKRGQFKDLIFMGICVNDPRPTHLIEDSIGDKGHEKDSIPGWCADADGADSVRPPAGALCTHV